MRSGSPLLVCCDGPRPASVNGESVIYLPKVSKGNGNRTTRRRTTRQDGLGGVHLCLKLIQWESNVNATQLGLVDAVISSVLELAAMNPTQNEKYVTLRGLLSCRTAEGRRGMWLCLTEAEQKELEDYILRLLWLIDYSKIVGQTMSVSPRCTNRQSLFLPETGDCSDPSSGW